MLGMRIESQAALAGLNGLEKQFRFAQAVALTRTAQFAQMDLRSRLPKLFDRPTPFTVNSTYVKRATPGNPVAEVGFRGRNPEKHYLAPQVQGGSRDAKRFEYHLRRAGLLGPDEYVVPARGFVLDAFGNVPRKVYSAILSDLQAHPDPLSNSTRESRSKRARRKVHSKRAVYFVSRGRGLWFGRRQHLPAGIYERTYFGQLGSAIRGVFMFVRTKPTYKARLPLQEIVQDNINLHLEPETEKALQAALATARPA